MIVLILQRNGGNSGLNNMKKIYCKNCKWHKGKGRFRKECRNGTMNCLESNWKVAPVEWKCKNYQRKWYKFSIK